MVAVIDEYGNQIKIYQTISGKLLRIFNRGRAKKFIISMKFSKNDTVLALISVGYEDPEATLHLFDL